MEHQIIKKISSLNDFDDDNEVEDIVEHNNAANKTHMKNMTTALSQSKGSNLANLGPAQVSAVSQASNNNKWTHNNTNHINSVNVSANHCSTPTNSSNNVSSNTNTNTNTNTSTKGTKTAKNIVANNLSPTKDEHLLRSGLSPVCPSP